MNKKKVACIKADGLNVLDDVGNVEGYCDMLKAIYNEDGSAHGHEDAKSTKEWAKYLGWTGRLTKPNNIL